MDVPRADPAHLDDVRADLRELGFTVDGVRALLGPVAAAALERDDPLPAYRRLARASRPEEPLSCAVALFTLGRPAPRGAVTAAFPRTGINGLTRLGLVRAAPGSGNDLVATCDVRPYGDESNSWWVASDCGELAVGGPLRLDHVLGVGGASVTLASWTPRLRVARALDLGTGSGVQALSLAGHAGEVVATDVSARALGYAAFTAALAGQRWDLRRGDLFEPVAGERFDLIVSNPPFVITPRRGDVATYDYRDGGRAGHEVVELLVRNAGNHLNPGGLAQLLGNWEMTAGQDWRAVWADWLEGAGVDAYVVQREVQDVAEYAATWARDGGHRPGTPAYEALVGAWLDDFAARGVERIGFGVATLHRRGAAETRSPWVDLVEHSGAVATPMGPAVLARVQARDWLAEHDVADLLGRRWLAAPDVTQERHYLPGSEDPSVVLIRQGGALGAAVRVDTVLAALVGVSDGELTAGQALGGIAVLLDVPVADVIAQAVPGMHELIAAGMLMPADA